LKFVLDFVWAWELVCYVSERRKTYHVKEGQGGMFGLKSCTGQAIEKEGN
jgi:hypothetical protein